MSEMVERVAKALAKSAGENWDAKDFRETSSGETPEEMHLYWSDLARAAIEAMREPTEHMLDIGACHESPGDHYKLIADEGDIAREVWQAMIDASIGKE